MNAPDMPRDTADRLAKVVGDLAPRGPALIFVSDDPAPTITVLDRADLAILNVRDRALCRALLHLAGDGLDMADRAPPRIAL